MRTVILSILICLLWSIDNGYSQGLLFHGNENRISERSSLQVFSDKFMNGPVKRIHISFEYAIINVNSPGYILYLKNALGEEAFNLTYIYEHGQRNFMFAQDGKKIFSKIQCDEKIVNRKWFPISLDIDIANNRAEIKVGNHLEHIENLSLIHADFIPQLYFGMYHHILETASFSIRNLKISNGETGWSFPLNENKGEEVHDCQGKIAGHITNPIWLINNSYYWKPVFKSYSNTPSGLAFNKQEQRFYVYNQDSIITYTLCNQHIEQLPYSSDSEKLPVRLGMNVLHETKEIIYAYELNQDDTYIAEINSEDHSWKYINQEKTNLQMHHHCGIYDSQRNRLLFFGGYGNRRYHNQFITFDLLKAEWDTLTVSGDSISPRFFAAMAVTPDFKYAYIYGGKGNKAGDQNIGIQYYYDLYQIDLENNHVKKLWEHKAPEENQVPVRSMILSKDKKHIYLLGYPEYKPQSLLQLYRISIADGSYEALGNSIPITSEEIATNANLYFNSEQDEFYCTVQDFEKYGQNTTRIYSLSNPPVSLADIELYSKSSHFHKVVNAWIGYIIVFVIVIIGLVPTVMFMQRRKNKKSVQIPFKKDVVCLEAPDSVAFSQEAEEAKTIPFESKEPVHNNLSLFGTFCVTDRHGRDITYMFSPKIRHIFLYLLVNSITKDGVLSADLNNLFWPDKPADKIKNLKNVTMNHLRKILQEMDGIELIHQNGYFKITLSDACYCDYQRLVLLTNGLQQTPLEGDCTQELFHVLSKGKFLVTIDSSIFDYHKQQIETLTIYILSHQLSTSYKTGKDTLTLFLCKILFSIDSLSDTAMTYTVCTYCRENRTDQAMRFYMTFCKEYKKIMDEDYPIPFDKVDIDHIRL